MMRHRLDPIDNNGHHPHRDSQQLIQLKRVIRLQNQVIFGLSSCFLIVIISTLILIQHLPHPHEENRPFWEGGQNRPKADVGFVDHHKRRGEKLKKTQQAGDIISRFETKKWQQENELQIANCSHYGCPLHPVEISQINNTIQSLIASENHILLTHKSNRKKPAPVNQDRAILIPSFGDGNYQTNNRHLDPHNNFCLGVFDGHDDNGHQIAQFASEEIPSRIASKMHNITYGRLGVSSPESMRKIITETFVEVDSNVPVTGGGCTATMVLRIGTTLYMANTGDSTQFIAVYHPPSYFDQQKAKSNEKYITSARSPDIQLHLQGKVAILQQNLKHKANFPEERARIEGLGGKLHIPKNPNLSRVIVRSALHREDVGLAMSRSIGDWEWTAIGVIPDPDVTILDLTKFWSENDIKSDDKVLVVMGSDGGFDTRKAVFVANHLAYGLFEYRLSQKGKDHDSDKFANHLIDVGKKLIDMASPAKEEYYRDDITFVAKVVEL